MLADSPTAPLRQLGKLGDEAKEANGSLQAAATNGPAPTSAAAESSGRRLAEVPPQGAVGGEISLGAAATRQVASDALAKAPAQAKEEDFVVVHVVVKRDALRNKTFDQLLTKNGIQLEESPEEETASGSAGEKLAEKDNVDRKLDRSAAQNQDVDVVLVEAPPTTIESCLSDLKQDQTNYLGVSVDDSPANVATDKDKSAMDAEVPAKKLATDLGTRFNRGTVPPQNLERGRREYFYDFYAGRGQEPTGGRGFGGGEGGKFGGVPKQEQEQARVESLGLKTKEQLGRGRARRFRSWGFEDRKNRDLVIRRGAMADDRQSTATPLQFGEVQQEIKAPAEAARENLYVLFVLSPEAEPPAAPPSPANQNRPE